MRDASWFGLVHIQISKIQNLIYSQPLRRTRLQKDIKKHVKLRNLLSYQTISLMLVFQANLDFVTNRGIAAPRSIHLSGR